MMTPPLKEIARIIISGLSIFAHGEDKPNIIVIYTDWKATIPAGQVYTHPVITLDFAATANHLAAFPIPKNSMA